MVIEGEGAGVAQQLFAIRRGLARPRYLVAVRVEGCARCGGDSRIISVWVTPRRVVERIAWCRYCFEAECGVVKPTQPEEAELERTLRAVDASVPITWFDCARPAIEALERWGLLDAGVGSQVVGAGEGRSRSTLTPNS
jgi:hypothetical protein